MDKRDFLRGGDAAWALLKGAQQKLASMERQGLAWTDEYSVQLGYRNGLRDAFCAFTHADPESVYEELQAQLQADHERAIAQEV